MKILEPLIFLITHFSFLFYAFNRSAPSYKLRRWEKQLIETVFVLLTSWLAYVLRDALFWQLWSSLYLLVFFLLSNIWCNCINFGIHDFLVAHAFQGAALFPTEHPYAPVALAVGGVSLMLVKNELLSN